jgi:hypothetical protein
MAANFSSTLSPLAAAASFIAKPASENRTSFRSPRGDGRVRLRTKGGRQRPMQCLHRKLRSKKKDLLELMRNTDTLAEIQNTLPASVSVKLLHCEANIASGS